MTDSSPESLGARQDVRELFGHFDDVAVWTVNEQRRFDYVGPGFEHIWDIPAEAIGADPTPVLDGVHPDDRAAVSEAMFADEGNPEPERLRHRVVRPDGTVRWVECRSVPVPERKGVVGVTTDITERRERERRLELLVRTMDHDIRNDIGAVTGWLELLEAEVGEHEALSRARRAAQSIVERTETARECVEAFADNAAFERDALRLAPVVRSEIEARRRSHPEAVFETGGELPGATVEANELLGAVVRNLLHNAVEHNDEATPRVRVAVDAGPETVVLTVSDDGPGVPEEKREAVFAERSAFERDDGLGLRLCREIVERCGGAITIGESDAGGAAVRVELRRAD